MSAHFCYLVTGINGIEAEYACNLIIRPIYHCQQQIWSAADDCSVPMTTISIGVGVGVPISVVVLIAHFCMHRVSYRVGLHYQYVYDSVIERNDLIYIYISFIYFLFP